MLWGDSRLAALRPALGAARAELAAVTALKARSERTKIAALGCPLDRGYFVTSDQGVYLLSDGLYRVWPGMTYGIGAGSGRLYLTALLGWRSYVLAGDAAALHKPGRRFRFRVLHEARVSPIGDRFHGLWLDGSTLWVANTWRNTLLRFDDEKLTAEYVLVAGRFGQPIIRNVNHVNSVAAYGDVALFVAYRAGGQSMIGLMGDGEVIGFGYPNEGVHDIMLTDDALWWGDTFGADKAGGRLMRNGEPVDPEAFDTPEGYMVRGFAGDDDELLIGHSHKGPRRHRFDGKGAILVARGGRIRDVLNMPFAQVYQIMRDDGVMLKAPRSVEHAEVLRRLSQLFGDPIYRSPISIVRKP